MGLLGQILLLSAPVRLLNVLARVVEIAVDKTPKEDRVLSGPLEFIAEAIEEL